VPIFVNQLLKTHLAGQTVSATQITVAIYETWASNRWAGGLGSAKPALRFGIRGGDHEYTHA